MDLKKFTFSNNSTDGAKAHEEAFGDVAPEELPYQLCWPSAFPDPLECDATCNEYGILLAGCVKRGKPVTVREYVDFFWRGADDVYRWNVTRHIETGDYAEFVRLVSAEEYEL